MGETLRGVLLAAHAIDEHENISYSLKQPIYDSESFTKEDDEVIHKSTMYNLGAFASGSVASLAWLRTAKAVKAPFWIHAAASTAVGACCFAAMAYATTYSGAYNQWLLNTKHSRLADAACDSRALTPLKDCAADSSCSSVLSSTAFANLLQECQRRDRSLGIQDHWYTWRERERKFKGAALGHSPR